MMDDIFLINSILMSILILGTLQSWTLTTNDFMNNGESGQHSAPLPFAQWECTVLYPTCSIALP